MRASIHAMALVCVAGLGAAPPRARTQAVAMTRPAPVVDSAAVAHRARLDVEKLQAEITKLRAETAEIGNFWSRAPFISAVLGIAALFGTAVRYLLELRKSREQDADASFAAAVGLLGSDSPNARASGAVSIVVFADARYGRLRHMVVDVLLAQLRLSPDAAQQRLLAASLGRAVGRVGVLDELDAAGADLSHVVLRDVTLPRANLAECRLDGSRFERATLTNATLAAAECRDVRFDACDLGGATLDRATLGQVRFTACELGGARLTGVTLTRCSLGARLRDAAFRDCTFFSCDFSGADLSGAVFGPQQDIDVDSARSLRSAVGFERATLDDAFRARLDAIVGPAPGAAARAAR
jgi:uncharacterized protein YjbI with pentapeptide repeats